MSRAQAAMEFMMTYGWVIMIVLIAIGTLVYLGVGPTGFVTFMPDYCTASQGMDCVEKPDVTTTTISFTLRNGHAGPVSFALDQLPLASGGDGCPTYIAGMDAVVKNQSGGNHTWTGMDGSSPDIASVDGMGTITLKLTCAGPIKKGRIKAEPRISYSVNEFGISYGIFTVIRVTRH